MMVSRIQQSLSFHDSPESFISSRLQQLAVSDPGSLPVSGGSHSIVKASILNRNVHIISSYRLCEAVLNGDVSDTSPISSTLDGGDDQPVFAAEPAYKQFMSAFFPGPNILLQDGPIHTANKERWKQKMRELVSEESGLDVMIRKLTTDRFVEQLLQPGSLFSGRRTTINLYESMKALAWDLLFGIFLGLERAHDASEFRRTEVLQEDLLRGQFSLFPVSVRTPFWSSSKSRGLNAVKTLQDFLAKRLQKLEGSGTKGVQKPSACPFMPQPDHGNDQQADERVSENDDIIAHLLVFTSSIANKALASLLTAFLMNLFLWRDSGGKGTSSLAGLLRSQEVATTKERMLRSILSETARLSPPVVGVMRRVRQDIVLREGLNQHDNDHKTSEYTIKTSHDAWLYLAGASRDPEVFEEADLFCWDRYMSAEDGEMRKSFAFGGGIKACLGNELARQICLTVAMTVLDSQLSFDGTVRDRGVRHWLGWDESVPLEAIAKDLKQLPCQRPRRPVNVDVVVQ